MGEPGYRKLSYLHAKRVEEFLHKYCRAENGEAVYEPGWDDNEVARIIVRGNEDLSYVTPTHVANLRRQVLGNVRRPKPATNDARLEQAELYIKRLATVLQDHEGSLKELLSKGGRAYVSDLGSRVAKLEARFKRLADGLGEHYDD